MAMLCEVGWLRVSPWTIHCGKIDSIMEDAAERALQAAEREEETTNKGEC